MAKIGIIDADLIDHGTRHPNLALMKIAGYYRDQGHEVVLIFESFDAAKDESFEELYMGCVFSFTKVPEEIKSLPNMAQYGGTGFFPDGGPNLQDEIEHHKPYYELYKPYVEYEIAQGRKPGYFDDYIKYSIGFTSRGCFRKCEFCVNKKYDHAFRHSHVQEFLDETRPYIYLWDDNILALPEWEKVIDELESTGRPYQFRQGLDLRLMTDRKAYRLVNAHYHGDFIFAFDHLEEQNIIVKRVQLWKRYSSRTCKMYVISGYKSQDEHDIEDVFERIRILMKYGSLPYIMRYELYKKSPYRDLYVQLARWCNQPQFFKKKSFREFCEANQDYKKDKTTNCLALQSMLDFEKDFPEIAKKYFDLRFDQQSIYKVQYGYGRRYANKLLCEECIKKGLCLESLLHHKKNLLQAYLTKQVDLECLRYENAECKIDAQVVAEHIIKILQETSLQEIVEILSTCDNREPVTPENIPQFSKKEDAYFKVADVLYGVVKPLTLDQLGKYLERDDERAKTNSSIAMKKYGENHAKMAALLDIVLVSKSDSRAMVCLSEFGKCYIKLSPVEQKLLVHKLCFRIPIVQNYFLKSRGLAQIDDDLMVLSKTTQNRRRSNVLDVVRSIESILL